MTNIEGLLGALLGAPALPGAKCRRRHRLFDEPGAGEHPDTVRRRHDQALRLCGVCPARQPCEEWLDRLPARTKPFGVIAGRVRTRKPRP